MRARVVNRRHEHEDVYIGRGSRWGNRWSHREGTKAQFVVGSIEEAIACYKRWLWGEIEAGRITPDELRALAGKRLGCYCKPQPCHGDVLVAAVDWALSQKEK